MSGRGRGRGIGGRGRQNSSGRSGNSSSSNSGGNNKNNYKPSKKTLSDYIYFLGSAKQLADYDTTTDFIINHIVKTFTFGNDIGIALSTKKPYNMDQHRPSLLQPDPKLTKDLQEYYTKQYDMEFKAEYDAFMKRKQFYEASIRIIMGTMCKKYAR